MNQLEMNRLRKKLDEVKNKYADALVEIKQLKTVNKELSGCLGWHVETIERYEKALNFYADKENYEVDDSELDPWVNYIHIVDMDEGYNARKALGIEKD